MRRTYLAAAAIAIALSVSALAQRSVNPVLLDGARYAAAGNASGDVAVAVSSGGLSHVGLWTASTGAVDLKANAVESSPNDINSSSQIAGSAERVQNNIGPVTDVFRWSRATGFLWMTPLSGTRRCLAQALNDAGVVVGLCRPGVGNSNISVTRAFMWDGVTTKEIPGPTTWTTSLAMSINNAGQVVIRGGVQFPDQSGIWSATSGFTLMPDGLALFAINNLGHAIGFDSRTGLSFLWIDGRAKYIPFPYARLNDINDTDQVIGTDTAGNAFAWDETVGVTTLSTGGFRSSAPNSIDSAGHVFGRVLDASGEVAAVWTIPPATVQEKLHALFDNVSRLREERVSFRVVAVLTMTLRAVSTTPARGEAGSAVALVEAFKRQVSKFVIEKKIAPERGDDLMRLANSLIASLPR